MGAFRSWVAGGPSYWVLGLRAVDSEELELTLGQELKHSHN